MTELEICGSYRRADNKNTQITILSELTMRMDVLDQKISDLEYEYKEIARIFTGTGG